MKPRYVRGLRHKSLMTKSRLTDGWGIIQNRWWMGIVLAVRGFRSGGSELSDVVYCKGGINSEFYSPPFYCNGDRLSAEIGKFLWHFGKSFGASRLFCSCYWFLELIIKRVIVHLIYVQIKLGNNSLVLNCICCNMTKDNETFSIFSIEHKSNENNVTVIFPLDMQ